MGKTFKRILCALIVAFVCLSLVACGGQGGTQQGADGEKDNNLKQDIYIYENSENGLTYLVVPNSKVISKYVVKVEITKDNWHEYFEDYEYTEHVVIKNDFGDIEEEFDKVHIGFGLKKNILGLVDKVSFKFDGKTEYSDTDFDKTRAETVEYEVYTANEATCSVYNYVTDELVEERPLAADEAEDYYLLEMKYSEKEGSLHFGNHNCIDAIGVLYVLNLPEGVYNGEEIDQIEYASGGGAGFGVGNLELFYNE